MKLSKKHLVLLIFIILVLLPEKPYIPHRFEKWRFLNFHFYEQRFEDGDWQCSHLRPEPKYALTYDSLLLDIHIMHDFCNEFEWYKENGILLGIGPLKGWEYPFSIQFSNKDFFMTLYDNWWGFDWR